MKTNDSRHARLSTILFFSAQILERHNYIVQERTYTILS